MCGGSMSRVVPYGSFVSGIGSHASDLDLSIEGTWRNGPDATPKQLSALSPEKRVSILRDMIGALRVSKTSKGYIEKVLHARVPVLKFVEATTGISCDLCLSNTTAVEKSAVLQWISEIDGRFVQLMSLVKLWAKAHGINDPTSGSFNGFALALMVMFHLQTLKVPMLPPLCEIFGGASDTFVDRPLAKEPGPETVQAFARARELAARYRDGRYGCCQLASVVELFAGFVVHMNAAFKWWLQGGTSHVRLSAWAGGWTVHGWSKSYAVAVEDPFDASENCARAIGRRNQERFKIHEAILQVMKVTSEAMSSITSETCLGDLIRALFGDKSLGLLPPELRNELKTGGPKICRWPDMPKQRVGLKPGDPEPPPSRNGAKGAKRRPSAAARKAQGNGKDSGGQGQSRNRASGEANGVGSKDSGKEQKADAQGDAAAEPPAVPDPIAEPRGAPRQAKRWGDDDTSADNEDPPRALGAGNGVATGNPPSKDKRLQAGAAEDVAAPREAAARSRWKKGQRDRKKSAETEHRREEPQSEAGVAAGTGNSLVPGAPHEAAAEAGAAEGGRTVGMLWRRRPAQRLCRGGRSKRQAGVWWRARKTSKRLPDLALYPCPGVCRTAQAATFRGLRWPLPGRAATLLLRCLPRGAPEPRNCLAGASPRDRAGAPPGTRRRPTTKRPPPTGLSMSWRS
uniref:Poly rna polymerase gld2-like n=1 Tax=Tetraselmis sp. GSL018 TaxID=582737 RepID=A0A061S6B8_9CHLO